MSDLAMVGLGRMGANMARRLARGGLRVTVYNRTVDTASELAASETGIEAAESLAGLVASMEAPRITWLMLPAGAATEETLEALMLLLAPGDIVVDGANSNYKDSVRRALRLRGMGFGFIDAGVSGGVWGLRNGYAIMLGGELSDVSRIERLVRVLAPEGGWLHCGPPGAGHYVKMIHNGIEYGMMQALAEGIALMDNKKAFGLDVAAIAEMWRHGSVVRSWLLDLTAEFLKRDSSLAAVEPFVEDSGEGRWTALEAIEQGIPTPVMSLALMMRFASQGRDNYTARLLAMMRKGFGGHSVKEQE